MTASFSHRLFVVLPAVLLLGATAIATADPAPTATRKPKDPDAQEVIDYRVSMDKIDKFVAATEATEKLGKANADVRARMQKNSENKAPTLDAKVKSIEADVPEAAAAIKAAGLSTREYMILGISLMSNAAVVAMKRQGAIHDYGASISPENAAFFEQNYDKIQEKLKRIQKTSAHGDGDGDGDRDGDDDKDGK